MNEIAIKIVNQVIQLPDPRPHLVAGSVGVYAVKLTYDAQWDNAPVRVVVFDGGLCNARISVQDTTGTVTIPPECIAHGNWLQIGVMGLDGTGALRITTCAMLDGLRIDPAGVSDADVPQDPPTATPGLWEQLVTDVGNLKDLQTEDTSSLVAAINELAEEMPDALPNPNSLTFTGAVTGSYDGSAPLSVEIPSGGGGGETWEKIAEIVIPEGADEATSLTINKDFDGNPFRLVKARLCAKFPKYTGATTIPNYSFAMLNGKTSGRVTPIAYTSVWPKVSASIITGTVYEIDVSGAQQIEHVIKTGTSGWSDDSSRDYVVYGSPNGIEATWFGDTLWAKPITSIGGDGMLIYPGCRFVLYGVRA